jgi:hypothetical protein
MCTPVAGRVHLQSIRTEYTLDELARSRVMGVDVG